MLDCAKEGGFDDSQVLNSMEKVKQEYANSNLEVEDHAVNNRLLFLIPHTFHDSLMEKVLTKHFKLR